MYITVHNSTVSNWFIKMTTRKSVGNYIVRQHPYSCWKYQAASNPQDMISTRAMFLAQLAILTFKESKLELLFYDKRQFS